MAKDTQFRTDELGAQVGAQANASTERQGAALGQGIAQGANNFRSGLAQQFEQQMQLRRMQQEDAQVGAHVAAMEMQKQESLARTQAIQQQLMTAGQLEQYKQQKFSTEMLKMQVEKSRAEMTQNGEIPLDERVLDQMRTHGADYEDATSPTGYSVLDHVTRSGAMGIKSRYATKEEATRAKDRRERLEGQKLLRDQYDQEMMTLRRLQENSASDPETVSRQESRVNVLRDRMAGKKTEPDSGGGGWMSKVADSMRQIASSSGAAQAPPESGSGNVEKAKAAVASTLKKFGHIDPAKAIPALMSRYGLTREQAQELLQ